MKLPWLVNELCEMEHHYLMISAMHQTKCYSHCLLDLLAILCLQYCGKHLSVSLTWYTAEFLQFCVTVSADLYSVSRTVELIRGVSVWLPHYTRPYQIKWSSTVYEIQVEKEEGAHVADCMEHVPEWGANRSKVSMLHCGGGGGNTRLLCVAETNDYTKNM